GRDLARRTKGSVIEVKATPLVETKQDRSIRVDDLPEVNRGQEPSPPWPFPLERRRARLAARHLPVHGRGRLCPGTMGYAREPVFLLSHSHPDRPRPARRHHGTLRLRSPSRIHRRDSDHRGKRTRARIVARGRARCGLQPAVSALSRYHGGSNSSVELAGYSDYAARVRWRLVPGIW